MMEFAPFRLDTVNQCLWRRMDGGTDKRILLAPKALAVLRYLVEHAGRLVTEAELLEAVWPKTFVQPEAIKSQLYEIRKTLGDNPRAPRYIETLPKRGYQFIAQIRDGSKADFAVLKKPSPEKLVGRERALEHLRNSLRTACGGRPQIVFVTGEPGIGKTVFVDEFQRQAAIDTPGLRIARGQCIEGYGGKEAYYPALEALGQLCAGSGATTIVDTLAIQAPTWLVQFPSLVRREHREMLQQEILGATRERMLREIGLALETIAAESPLLLVFEDLQWVDRSTVDLLSALARRRTRAKLMLICTLRPLDMTSDQPLKALREELLAHRLCQEMPLEPLLEADVAEFLAADSPQPAPHLLTRFVHRHTGGNPLFMVAALDNLMQRGLISCNGGWKLSVPMEAIDLGVPENLRQMIETQINRLSAEEQQALEAASVAGAVFTTSVCAAAIGRDSEDFEDLCEGLVRRQRIVRSAGTRRLPDGSISQLYEFTHELYREVLYQRQAPRRRASLHRRIGERLEVLPSQQSSHDRLDDVASELSHHFERAAAWENAIGYARLASDVAVKRFSPSEATHILTHGLSMVEKLPIPLRTSAEVELLERAASISAATYDAATVEQYDALATRAEKSGMTDVQVRALMGQAYPTSWFSMPLCSRILDHAIELNRRQPDPVIHATVEANGHFWRLWLEGWNDDSAAVFDACYGKIERTADRRSIAWHRLQQAFVWFMSSRYRECRDQIEREFPVLVEGTIHSPDLNLGLAHWGAYQLVRPWSAIFLGEWTQAEHEFEEGIASLDRNRALYHANTLRLYGAWGKVIAHDFASARRACEVAAPNLDSDGLRDNAFPAEFLPAEERIKLITLGAAEAGLGQYDLALGHLESARQQMLENPVLLNWYWLTALEWVIAQVHLVRKDVDRASKHAEAMLDLTATWPEATWRTLALATGARVAALRGDWALASERIENALTLVHNAAIPVAAWQVHAAAAELYSARGNGTSAQHHHGLSRAGILKLVNALPNESSARKNFLSAPSVAAILGNEVPVLISL